jgi:hypothetical protein
MAIILNQHDAPIAYTMIATAKRVKPRRDGQHPYQVYFYLWTAFDNIYSLLAGREGLEPKLLYNADGSVARIANGSVNIPVVEEISEEDLMQVAIDAFDLDLQHQLIQHESTRYFAHRIPYWQGKKIEQDAAGQRVNGVINVKHTLDAAYPVWSPIDIERYAAYLENGDDDANRRFLTQQIVALLHTVRKNMTLPKRSFDDSNDLSVVVHALPLLEIIINFFTR